MPTNIVDSVLNFVGKWFTTFVLVFIVTSVVMGYLNLIAGYAVVIVVLLGEIIKQLRRIATNLES